MRTARSHCSSLANRCHRQQPVALLSQSLYGIHLIEPPDDGENGRVETWPAQVVPTEAHSPGPCEQTARADNQQPYIHGQQIPVLGRSQQLDLMIVMLQQCLRVPRQILARIYAEIRFPVP